MSKSAGGNVDKTTQNQQTSGSTMVDPQTQQWMQQIFNAAQGAGQAGPSPLVTGASDYYGNQMKAGNLGMGALSGDQGAAAQLMNPYQNQVIGGINKQWDQTDQGTMNAVNDRAMMGGAFGGSRHGIATGTALGQNNMNRNSQVGGLLHTGFNDAMGRAGQLAGMGMAGAGANANLGMGGVGNPQQWLMQMMKQGFMGPMGQMSNSSSSGAQTSFGGRTQFSTNPFG